MAPPATATERTSLLGDQSSNQHTYHLPNAAPREHLRTPSPTGYTTLLPQNDIGVANTAAPSTVDSIKALLFSGYLNLLLVAVPLSFISHFLHWGSTADFIISFIAIVPLASLLGDATEQCALKLGSSLGGLLNATFGNAVEAIVGILALTKGELRIVQTSMLGSILSNILLVLGCSFLAAGYKFKESNFQVTAAQASSSLMVLGTSTLVIPAAYHASRLEKPDGMDLLEGFKNKDFQGLLTLSRGTAIVLIICYASYLYFQLSSHAYLFEDESEQEEEEAKMNIWTAGGSLLVVTVITSFCADYLVGAIDEFANDFSIPKAFIGLILLPIVGNAAEHVTSVWMAMKGKMEITIGVSVGSSIQIAVGVIPVLVIVGWIIGQDLTLFFENFETIILFVSIFLVNILITDGKSNWLEGLMLVALYFIIALAFWVS
ncbi:Sodium/calcium exchanger protein-domain-containing protein [Leucosporidium creatinivorum]|uniref:Vacuolar calcium ion transporter n=1 Tax=Leucosporidium creatinivorum TaxID=106004 RepID=A0A1Y2D7S9_9BASI|nr:Sodium/calcium exchanger protein-domain-containing protein [Leucosporidium creatinivorum]